MLGRRSLSHDLNIWRDKPAEGDVGVAQEFVLLALALLARQVVLEGQFEGRHKQDSSLTRCAPVICWLVFL